MCIRNRVTLTVTTHLRNIEGKCHNGSLPHATHRSIHNDRHRHTDSIADTDRDSECRDRDRHRDIDMCTAVSSSHVPRWHSMRVDEKSSALCSKGLSSRFDARQNPHCGMECNAASCQWHYKQAFLCIGPGIHKCRQTMALAPAFAIQQGTHEAASLGEPGAL